MMQSLEVVRKRWMELRDEHKEFGEYIAVRIQDRIRREGILAKVTTRVKPLTVS
jgi:hypothetical protein